MSRLLAPMDVTAPDLQRLFEANGRQVWRTLLRLGVPPPRVEDAVQDVFLIAQERLASFEGRSAPATWLIGIAVRVAAKERRGEKRAALSLVDAQHADPAEDPEQQLAQRRALAALEAVLAKLPTEQREVLVLMDLEALPAPQVAEALEVKLNTVYSRLRLGRAALSRALTGTLEMQS